MDCCYFCLRFLCVAARRALMAGAVRAAVRLAASGGVPLIGSVLKSLAPTAGAQRYYWRHDGLIHFMEGRRGRGKSYNLTELMRWCAVNRVQCRTNVRSVDYYRLALQLAAAGSFPTLLEAMKWLRDNIIFLDTWDDLLESYNCIVVIDEVTRLFEGRAGFQAQKTPPVIYEWFQQSRKFRCTIWVAGQSFEWVDKKLAQLVDILWLCRKVPHKKLKAPDGTPAPVQFFMYGLDPGGAGKSDKVIRSSADYILRNYFKVEVATLYDSWERIRLIGGEPKYPNVAAIDRFLIDSGKVLENDTHTILNQRINSHEQSILDRTDFFEEALTPGTGRATASLEGGSADDKTPTPLYGRASRVIPERSVKRLAKTPGQLN